MNSPCALGNLIASAFGNQTDATPLASPPLMKYFTLLRQGSKSALISFGNVNLDQHLVEVNVLDKQAQAFADPHPATVDYLSNDQVDASEKAVETPSKSFTALPEGAIRTMHR